MCLEVLLNSSNSKSLRLSATNYFECHHQDIFFTFNFVYTPLNSNQSTFIASRVSVFVWQAKRRKGNRVVSMPQETVTKPDENSLPPPTDQAGATDGSQSDAAADKREDRVHRRCRKRHAVEKPPEGGMMTEADQKKYAFVWAPKCPLINWAIKS